VEDEEVGENAELLEKEKTLRHESMSSVASHLYDLPDNPSTTYVSLINSSWTW
jgi:hypothetical protein